MRRWGSFPLGRWHVSWSLPDVPYLSVHWYWRDEHVGSLGIAFSSRGRDSIVAFDSPDYTPPAWLHRVLDLIAR